MYRPLPNYKFAQPHINDTVHELTNVRIANFDDLSYLLTNRSIPFDVKTKVGDEQVYEAHSTILSTRSVYFQNALSSQTKEFGLFIFELSDISSLVFEVILK